MKKEVSNAFVYNVCMKLIHQTYKIHAPINKVWQALIDPGIIDQWGGGPAEMSDQEGMEFSLWGGDIYGKNLHVVPEKELHQEWFGGEWDQPSLVTFTLSEKDDVTTVELLHENIPDDEEAEDFDTGWKEYYLGPLKELIESN